jgi:hypothetical protein
MNDHTPEEIEDGKTIAELERKLAAGAHFNKRSLGVPDARMGGTDATPGTVKTILTQGCKPLGKAPAKWRKVAHNSYAAL